MPRHWHEVLSPDGTTIEMGFCTNQKHLSAETERALEDLALTAAIYLEEHGLLDGIDGDDTE